MNFSLTLTHENRKRKLQYYLKVIHQNQTKILKILKSIDQHSYFKILH